MTGRANESSLGHGRRGRSRSQSRERHYDRDDRRRRSRSRSHSRDRARDRDHGDLNRSKRRERRSRSYSKSRSRSPVRRRSISKERERKRGRSRSRTRSRSPGHERRKEKRRRSRSRSSSVSSSDSSDPEDRSRPKKKKDKHKKKRSRSRDRKERKREKKEKKKKKKLGAASHQWGKYGIINETDLFTKEQEFRSWLVEERKINPETTTKEQTRKEFARFVEDYNTATLPHEKFYNMQEYERRMDAVRSGAYVPPADDGYDPNADMRALQSTHKRKAADTETYLSREQLLELRKVQAERVEAGKMKLLGMDIKQTLGVRMDGSSFE